MVYDSDFYTTRRPYRASPAYSSYTSSFEPSRQVRILPGLGKVHIVHSYDRIVPYVGHKRLTVVTSPPKVFATRPSVLHREYDWIEHKVRPRVGYSATNRYLNSDSAVRIYYSNYPISSSYYSTLSLPTSYYYPKTYRWYYDSPRTYTSVLPSSYRYYWPSSSYYNWPRSYYNSYSWPSTYLNNWPYYRNMLTYLRNHISEGREWSYYPDAKFVYHYKIYRPLSFYDDWPITSRERFPQYWPSNRSYWYYLNDFPSEAAFREIRLKNDLYFDR